MLVCLRPYPVITGVLALPAGQEPSEDAALPPPALATGADDGVLLSQEHRHGADLLIVGHEAIGSRIEDTLHALVHVVGCAPTDLRQFTHLAASRCHGCATCRA